MDCYFLDKVSWQQSQGLYHAAAHLGREALFILRPSTPYVCIGFHQDAEQEIDLEFAASHGIPVFRREVGGGAVYLDGGQLFYQLVVHANRPGLPVNKAEFYRRFLQPVIETYRDVGVAAEYKPVNDILAAGRKVSGNGAAEIEGSLVLVGNFIMDFDYATMARVLRVPDEKFRDKVHKSLEANLSTIRRETGRVPACAELANGLARHYQPLLGHMQVQTEVDPELRSKADELIAAMHSREWLHANDRRRPRPDQVKIREGVYVIQNMLKTPGGLLRITAINDEGYLRDVHISGDFFFYPAQCLPDLEQQLRGAPTEMDAITQVVRRFYAERSIESPGLEPADISKALLPAA